MAEQNQKNIEDLLFDLYYSESHPSAYSTCERLYSYIKKNTNLKVKKEFVLQWLIKQKAYTLHRDRVTRFQRCNYNISNIDDLWEMDLIDVQSISRKNRGYRFILAVIDCFSKYAWCIPIKRKTPKEIISAFNVIFSSTTRRPMVLQSDKGREFNNSALKQFLASRDITFHTTKDPVIKASICERFIRTIKAIIYKYFTHTNDTKYFHVLDMFVSNYNNRKHSTIGMAPANVCDNNVLEVWLNIQKRRKPTNRKNKYRIAELVRVSNPKTIFEKGYKPKWSDEIFTIDKCIWKSPVVYRLRDSNGKLIDGNFYEKELQRVNIS